MKRVYKSYSNVIVDGNVKYCVRVEECLDSIDDLPDGRGLLKAIGRSRHSVTIRDTEPGKGNATSRRGKGDGYCPTLLRAIHRHDAALFQTSLRDALENARRSGMSLEHVARQLTLGLSPVTYNRHGQNVARPRNVSLSWFQRHFMNVKTIVDRRVATNAQTLINLATGELPLGKLPTAWRNSLPRILRIYLTPGVGLSPTVKFNPVGFMHCVDDPAMHQRPPAIGLAHELIHALHCVKGVNQANNRTGNQKLEEVITTGFVPYNFEEFSDNKLRTQWPVHLQLREKY